MQCYRSIGGAVRMAKEIVVKHPSELQRLRDVLIEAERKTCEAIAEILPGAHGAGHYIASTDGDFAAEVFAAVSPTNNKKLGRDLAKVAKLRAVTATCSSGRPRSLRVSESTTVSGACRSETDESRSFKKDSAANAAAPRDPQ